ncbi:MAG: 6-bladed beta-propeller [Prevotellaceae bacterium]|jgi:hypothetical protein|nr:6-bladed beta-propeller [Prevotellaceae bacterium]
MKKKHLYPTILSCIFFASCNDYSGNAITAIPDTSIVNISLSSIIDHCELIALRSDRPDAVINDQFGLKLLVTDLYIYVLPAAPNNKKIHVFSNPDGNFIYCLDKIGRGPGEYLSITDFDVYKDSIYVLNLNTIITYTQSGNFIKEYKVGIRASNFKVIDENTFLIVAMRTEEYKLYVINEQKGVINKYLRPKESLRLTKTVDPLLLDQNFLIYQLGRSNDFALYNTKENSFKNERLVTQNILSHEEEEKHLVKQGLNQFGLNDYNTLRAVHISKMAGTNKDLFFTIKDTRQGVKQTHYIMSKDNGKIRYAIEEPYIDDVSFTGSLLTHINDGSSDNFFISYFQASELKDGIKNFRSDSYTEPFILIKDFFANYSGEDDDIVLVKFCFK